MRNWRAGNGGGFDKNHIQTCMNCQTKIWQILPMILRYTNLIMVCVLSHKYMKIVVNEFYDIWFP